MNAWRTIVERSDALAHELERRGALGCELAFVLGSGLGALSDALADARAIEARELEHLPRSRVPGHRGRILVGRLGGARAIVQEGRVHLYEGWSAFETTRAVRAFARLGVRALFLTNAAGSLRADARPGTLMRVVDHLDLQGPPGLARAEAGRAAPYDEGLGRALERAAEAEGIELARGVYAGLLGPSYETPAEIRMLRALGADAVGMSTVAEASVARALGLRVAAVSCLTNPAAGLALEPLRHEDVVAVGRAASERLARLFVRVASELARGAAI